MKAWLIYAQADAKRNEYYIRDYFTECRKRGIRLELIYLERICLSINGGKIEVRYDDEVVARPDFVVCRAVNRHLSMHLEGMGIPVFNNSFVGRVCNDKMKTYQYVASFGIPVLDVVSGASQKNFIPFPHVIKPTNGSGGKNVFLVRNENEAREAMLKIKNEDFIVQKMASDLGRDLRVYVVGKSVIASILRESSKDFRSNYCLGGKASPYCLGDHELRLVNSIIEHFEFGFVGIDFIFDKGKDVFNEIEDVVGSRMIYAITDINVVSVYVDHIISTISKKAHDS